jgi:CTP:phosphocholine cytidylyltransferase-like protein
MTFTAVILATGLLTHLGEITESIPKPIWSPGNNFEIELRKLADAC